jgi:hypothetical protein
VGARIPGSSHRQQYGGQHQQIDDQQPAAHSGPPSGWAVAAPRQGRRFDPLHRFRSSGVTATGADSGALGTVDHRYRCLGVDERAGQAVRYVDVLARLRHRGGQQPGTEEPFMTDSLHPPLYASPLYPGHVDYPLRERFDHPFVHEVRIHTRALTRSGSRSLSLSHGWVATVAVSKDVGARARAGGSRCWKAIEITCLRPAGFVGARDVYPEHGCATHRGQYCRTGSQILPPGPHGTVCTLLHLFSF